MGNATIKVGEKFGRLTVLERKGSDKHRNPLFLCKCICGTEKVIISQSLKSGSTKSCGCFRVEARLAQPGEITYRACYQDYRANAKKRNIYFDLSFEQFKSIAINNCHYCGSLPKSQNAYLKVDKSASSILKLRTNINSEIVSRSWVELNGIDRKNSSLGYYTSNCVSRCSFCNRAKGSTGYEDFVFYLNNLTNFRKQLGES